MAVKELIKLYEPSSLPSSSTGVGPNEEETSNGSLSELLPRPARFIKHEGITRPMTGTSTKATEADPSPPPSFIHGDDLTTFDIADSLSTSTVHLLNRSRPPTSLPSLPLTSSNVRFADEAEGLIQCGYPPKRHSWGRNQRPAPSDTSGRVSESSARSHIPIPATVVFARSAAPLHLPRLDKYLASMPNPTFPGKSDEMKTPYMFPPMDQLAKTGSTLDDLEVNSQILPVWRNRKSILGATLNFLLGFMGSSALASFYSLQGLVNTVQIFALILSTIVPLGGKHLEDKWRKLFMGTIPNVLALNFASTLIQSLLYLVIFMAIAACLLYYFYCSTFHCDRYKTIEGLQQVESRGQQWGLAIVTFLLTVMYLPLSTMAVHVIVWSQELWAIPNPYINATSFPPNVALLGPSVEFRDPLDFCWTTTMKRNEINYAPVVIALSAIAIAFLTIWFPIALHRVIKRSVPSVDKYNGLGRLRTEADLDTEYHRLLDRDRNPFAFLYNGFRRGWATYESTYLFAKLSTLVIIAVIDPDNCLFRSLSRSTTPIIRQVLLLTSTIFFFIAQCLFAPFLDPVNNASEWTSRLNYVTTATTALAITLNIPGKDIIDTYVLYSIYIVTYGLGFYFTAINFDITQRLVKRLTRRIDFSIDIFSPRLDVSPSSIHIKRRIWQESITTLLLTTESCQIPSEQAMSFAQARDAKFPPYLLDFMGTPGERHVESMKILHEVGSIAFSKAVALKSGPDYARYKYLEDEIQRNYIGPDSYWNSQREALPSQCKSFFGNAWWIPFPPTLVMRYDDGPIAVIRETQDLEDYITQNSRRDVQRRKQVRLSLRALEGQLVFWPHEHIRPVGIALSWLGKRGRYNATTSTHYRTCVLNIKRRGHLTWDGLHLGSGFRVELAYARNVRVLAEIIGLNDEFDLTSPLAKFLELNRSLVDHRLHLIEEAIASYRHFYRKESRWKNRVLSYSFLTEVYAQPRDPAGLAQSCIAFERDPRVRQLMISSEAIFETTYQRFTAVSKSEAATWWYIFWDDLWRRNYDTIAGLRRHASDFSPHYVTSVAYTPLPRAALESFLSQRGLLHSKPHSGDFFHSGFLNKLYLRLNEAVFHNSNRAIMFHIGHDPHEFDMEELDIMTQGQSSTLGTGGGTDHDASWIRARPTYRWEGLLTDSVHKWDWGRRNWFAKLGAWFGVTPLWRSGIPSEGLSLDVRLEGGRYEILDDQMSGYTWNESVQTGKYKSNIQSPIVAV